MKYRIRIDGGYYAAGSPYRPVPFDRADIVDRKSVDRICATLRRLGYQPAREEVPCSPPKKPKPPPGKRE